MTGLHSGIRTTNGRPAITPTGTVVVVLGPDFRAPAATVVARVATAAPTPLTIDTALRVPA